MLFKLPVPDSKAFKDGLMLVNLPKHVVKIKIKYVVLFDRNQKIFCCLVILNCILLHVSLLHVSLLHVSLLHVSLLHVSLKCTCVNMCTESSRSIKSRFGVIIWRYKSAYNFSNFDTNTGVLISP